MVDEPVAIIAILLVVIKELISFLKEKRDEKKKEWSGEERRSASVEEVNNSIQLLVLPIMKQQTDILVQLEELSRENSERALNTNYTLQFGITGLKENQAKMQLNLHSINNQMQTVINEIQHLDRRQ